MTQEVEEEVHGPRTRRFIPQATDSGHDFEVALNVARRLVPTAINQLWVADITLRASGTDGCVSGGCHGCVFPQDRRLESGAEDHNRARAYGAQGRY